MSPAFFLTVLDSPVRSDSSISSDLHSSMIPSTTAWSPAFRITMSSLTTSLWSISFSSPSRRTVTFGLVRRVILSSLRLARISWIVEIRMLIMMIPVAETALTGSLQTRSRIPRMKRTMLNGVNAFFTKMSV